MFTLKQGETTIFSSSSPHPMFYGEYGDEYSSPEAAYGACRMFMFRNAAIMDMVGNKETMTEVQQGVVDGMMARYRAFRARMKEIRHDHNDEQGNSLQKTVPSLDKLLFDSVKVIDSIIPEIESDTSEVAALGGEKEYTEKNVDNEASVYLLRICEKMKKMRKALKTEFGDFLEAGALPEGPLPPPVKETASNTKMCRYASLLDDDPDLLADIIADHIESICSAEGGGHVRNIEKTCDSGWLFLVKTARGEFAVSIGDDALFRGLFPSGDTCRKYPFMSLGFWNDIMKPAVAAVGHWLDSQSGFLILPETAKISVPASNDGSKSVDVLKAFNTGTGSDSACEISLKRGKRTRGDLCCIRSVLLISTASAPNMESRLQKFKNATMVTVVKPGSKYNGIAGSIDPERMKVRNNYIEIPVRIKFDTGLETEVWMADDEVEVFMEGGNGIPEKIQKA